MPNCIFIKSEPISAIFVKIPPATRRADAPSDSPIAKPIKHAPASSPGTNSKITSIMISSIETNKTPILIPALSGMPSMSIGLPLSAVNAVLEFASVFILIPNQATRYEPKIPRTDQPRIVNTADAFIPCKYQK